MHSGECSDADALARYADGTLDPRERTVLEQHLVTCADCRMVVVETSLLNADGDRSTQAPPQTSRLWSSAGVAAALAAAAALVLAVWIGVRGGAGGDDVRPELQELVAAVAREPARPVEGRLTGGFAYAPPPPRLRAAVPAPDLSPEVTVAIAALERRARATASADLDAALGVAYLIGGNLDEAIATLERACAVRPNDARCWSDLAAAALARGSRSGNASDLDRAHAAAARALALDPALAEAAFNRALVLDYLRAPDAPAAWEAVRALDPESPWGEEAERRARTTAARP